MMSIHRSEITAFSLVEVTLALGIASFALIAVFGLLPVGVSSNRTSLEQTGAASLLTAVAADMRAAPIMASGSSTSRSPVFRIEIPSTSSPGIRHVYCAEDGSRTSAENARYLVSVGMTPPSTGKRSATSVRILITWPATANANVQPDEWPSQSIGSLEVVTALNRN